MASSRSTSFDRRGFDGMILTLQVMFVVYALVFVLYSWKIAVIMTLWNAICYMTLMGATARPSNNPNAFVNWSRHQQRRRPVVLCLGDSLTHGTLSANITETLALKLCTSLGFAAPPKDAVFADPVWVVNAGQNGISTHTILTERLNTALNVYPDYILLWIGTNDVQCMVPNSKTVQRIMTSNALPERPTLTTFERNLHGILRHVHEASPKVEIGVCTLPPMGEDLSSASNQCVRNANAVIERVVASANANSSGDKVSLVPVFAQLETVLEKAKNKKSSWPFIYWMVAAMVEHPLYICGNLLGLNVFTWNMLSQWFGFFVMSDGLHLNERGRDIVVDCVVEWLNRKSIAKAIAVKQ